MCCKVLWLKRYFFLVMVLLFSGCLSFLVDTDERPVFAEPVTNSNSKVLGTWWWWVDPKTHIAYLDFAANNGVNEIYYYTKNFSNTDGNLIEAARERGIKVFLLFDKYDYIWDYPAFDEIMGKYFAYQNSAPEARKFAGLHLDVEPQSHPDYPQNRKSFLQDYMDFVVWACSKYKTPTVTMDFDIGWWFDEYVTYREEKERLYKALIIEADRVFIMSYKDTAEEIFKISKEEMEFAKSLDKQIILGIETGNGAEKVDETFYGRDLAYFYEQVEKLLSMLDYDNIGLSIHYISSWKSMHP